MKRRKRLKARKPKPEPEAVKGATTKIVCPFTSDIHLQKYTYHELVKHLISRPNIVTCLSITPSYRDYVYEFERLLNFVKNFEEFRRSELGAIIFPLFVYSYFTMLNEIDKADAFYHKFVHIFGSTKGYNEVLKELYEVKSKTEFGKHPYFKNFRLKKYIVRLPAAILKKLNYFLESIKSKALWQILCLFFYFEDPDVETLSVSDTNKKSTVTESEIDVDSSSDESCDSSEEQYSIDDDHFHDFTSSELFDFFKKDFVDKRPLLTTYFEWIESDVYSVDLNENQTELCITTGEPCIVMLPLKGKNISSDDEEISFLRKLAEAKSNPLIQLAEAEPERKRILQSAPVYTAKYFPKQPHLVLAASGTEIIIVNTSSEAVTSFNRAHASDIWDVDINSTGSLFCSASHDKTCCLWNCNKSSVARTYEGHKSIVSTVKFHPSGIYLVSGSMDCDVRLWDIEESKCVRCLVDHQAPVSLLTCSPDKKKIASADINGIVKLWDMQDNVRSCDLECYKKNKPDGTRVTAMCFRDENYLVLCNSRGLIRTWDVRKPSNSIYEEEVKGYMPVFIRTNLFGALHVILKKRGIRKDMVLKSIK